MNFSVLLSPTADKHGKLQVKLNEMDAISTDYKVTSDKKDDEGPLGKVLEVGKGIVAKHVKGK